MSSRTILHVNIVNFFVSVARATEPNLRTYPVVVASAGAGRKVVLDLSLEAWDAGVRRGMVLDAAKRLCPDLHIVNPSPESYEKAGSVLMKKSATLSPLAEPAGPGHVFVDLTGTQRLLGSPLDIATKMRTYIREALNVDCAIGLGANRLVSKIATRVIKPTGLCTVMPGCETEFMGPLPIAFIPGLEERIITQLTQFNLREIRDIHSLPASVLARALGPIAYEIARQARGIDDTPVRALEENAPSIEETLTLEEQTNDEHAIACALFHLVSKAGAQLRKMGLAVSKLRVKITYADGSIATRSIRLAMPLRGDISLFEQYSGMMNKLYTRRVRLTHIAVEFTELTFPYGQVDLFLDNEKEEQLMTAIDTIRGSFGDTSIGFWGREHVA